MNRVLHMLSDVPMYYQQKGLALIAKKRLKLDVSTLPVGEYVLFINKPFNACKLMAANNVLIYHRHPLNHRLNYHALKLIPDFFDGFDLNYGKAFKRWLKSEYPNIVDFKVE